MWEFLRAVVPRLGEENMQGDSQRLADVDVSENGRIRDDGVRFERLAIWVKRRWLCHGPPRRFDDFLRHGSFLRRDVQVARLAHDGAARLHHPCRQLLRIARQRKELVLRCVDDELVVLLVRGDPDAVPELR